MVLKLILSNTDNLSRYLEGKQMGVITAKKTADTVVKTLSNRRNEESFTQMWSHADVIAQKIRLTNRFHVAVRLFSNRSQMTSKCGKNKKVAHEA